MPETFDPYHKWLGIPPKDQPPNHYRLLAIDLFESDPDVIDAAASKQMAYLRNLATGPHVALSQKLLNELAAARICLLNLEKKAAYDAELRGQEVVANALQSSAGSGQAPATTAAAPLPAAEAPIVAAKPTVAAVGRPVPHDLHRKKSSLPVYAAIGAGALAVVTLLGVLMSGPGSDEVARNDQPKPPANQPEYVPDVDPPVTPPPVAAIATPPQEEPEPGQPAEDETASPGEVEQSPPEASSTDPAIDDPPTVETPDDDDPGDSPDSQAAPTIPPLPADAEEQLKNGLAESQSPKDFQAVAEKALRFVDQAIVLNDAQAAKRLATSAISAAREAKNDDLSKTATLRYLELQEPLAEDVIESARKRLEKWKPMLGSEEGASIDASDSPIKSTPDSEAPRRSLADLLRKDAADEEQAGDNHFNEGRSNEYTDSRTDSQGEAIMNAPRFIQAKTDEWGGSSSDYAQYSNRRFSVGMGGGNRNGYGRAGIEIEGIDELRIVVRRGGTYTGWDANDFAGFIIDYHTASGYSKRVALSIGFHSKKRSNPGPPWGTGSKFHELHDLGNKAEYALKLNQWAPQGWDGRVWFTVMLQNAGRHSTLSAEIVSPSEWGGQ